ncbi:PREDICTED: mitochondrial import receptor subunit TOM5 homolog [Camelina sativa]|uniref:Mitochondrial import receptor subunit TOM5 homolog n=1 Tax=Camelina sativa TaxID=90675 RepID=A0ABM1QV19_CAMSA|nr:PREDICTED: mitochondrial import receptor subunit TOM5 homolog [Camelina sativa]
MANNVVSFDKLKAFWHSEVHDEQKWAVNMKLLRALGMFAGGVFLMRNYGDLMGGI